MLGLFRIYRINLACDQRVPAACNPSRQPLI